MKLNCYENFDKLILSNPTFAVTSVPSKIGFLGGSSVAVKISNPCEKLSINANVTSVFILDEILNGLSIMIVSIVLNKFKFLYMPIDISSTIVSLKCLKK